MNERLIRCRLVILSVAKNPYDSFIVLRKLGGITQRGVALLWPIFIAFFWAIGWARDKCLYHELPGTNHHCRFFVRRRQHYLPVRFHRRQLRTPYIRDNHHTGLL